jgi:hypothetical protein
VVEFLRVSFHFPYTAECLGFRGVAVEVDGLWVQGIGALKSRFTGSGFRVYGIRDQGLGFTGSGYLSILCEPHIILQRLRLIRW